MYLWKAACDRLNWRKKKKEERIKREVRRMGRNAKRFFTQPSFFTTMMTFNQGTKETSINAYTRRAPKLQTRQVIFKRIGDTTYRLEYANIAFDLNTHLAEQAVTAIRDTLEHLGPRYDDDSKRREEERHETDKTELTLIINRYRQLNTLMSAVPEPINSQTGRREKRGVITNLDRHHGNPGNKQRSGTHGFLIIRQLRQSRTTGNGGQGQHDLERHHQRVGNDRETIQTKQEKAFHNASGTPRSTSIN
jgi:hypothetical protein